jgi:hypothetical protein
MYIIAFEGLAYNPQMYTHPQFLPFTALPSIHPIENTEGQYQLTENPQLHPLEQTHPLDLSRPANNQE